MWGDMGRCGPRASTLGATRHTRAAALLPRRRSARYNTLRHTLLSAPVSEDAPPREPSGARQSVQETIISAYAGDKLEDKQVRVPPYSIAVPP